MDAFKTFGDDSAHALQQWPLGRPVATATGAILFTRQDDQRRAICLITHPGIVDAHLFHLWHVDGVATFLSIQHLVLDPDIGKGAAHHHFVVATTAAIAVPLCTGHVVCFQIFGGWTIARNVACRADVIRRRAVGHDRQTACTCNRTHGLDFARDIKEGRLLDIGAGWIPGE